MITIKNLVDTDFVNYKKISLFLGFPSCNWKCGGELCQNSKLALSPDILIEPVVIAHRFVSNPLTEAVVCGGLEPLDSFDSLIAVLECFRNNNVNCEFVIYTGYEPEEIQDKMAILAEYGDIVMKTGRYIPNQVAHYDEVLGVFLASDNQKGIRL